MPGLWRSCGQAMSVVGALEMCLWGRTELPAVTSAGSLLGIDGGWRAKWRGSSVAADARPRSNTELAALSGT